jgi:hydroxymethylbilane synthase
VLRTRAERAVATVLEGSCQVPLAVFAEINGEEMRVRGMVGTPDGSQILRAEQTGSTGEVDRLSAAVADELLNLGAGRIIAALS